MLTPAVESAINEQINNELYSAYYYLAMAAYCERERFNGCGRWLRMQSAEENAHAMKLFDLLIARDGKIVLQAIEQPPVDYQSLADVFRQAYDHEQGVTQRIDALYALAMTEKSFATMVELEWFITEQVEEEKSAREIVHKFELIQGDPAGLLELDRELGGRAAPGGSA